MIEPTQEKPIAVNPAFGGFRWTCVCGVSGQCRTHRFKEDGVPAEERAAEGGQAHLEKFHQDWIDTKGAVYIHPRVKRGKGSRGPGPRVADEPVKQIAFSRGKYSGSHLIAVMVWTPDDPQSFQLWGDFSTVTEAEEFGRRWFPFRHRVVGLMNPRMDKDLKTIPAYVELIKPGAPSDRRIRK